MGYLVSHDQAATSSPTLVTLLHTHQCVNTLHTLLHTFIVSTQSTRCSHSREGRAHSTTKAMASHQKQGLQQCRVPPGANRYPQAHRPLQKPFCPASQHLAAAVRCCCPDLYRCMVRTHVCTRIGEVGATAVAAGAKKGARMEAKTAAAVAAAAAALEIPTNTTPHLQVQTHQ
jgi:hypothetical protein